MRKNPNLMGEASSIPEIILGIDNGVSGGIVAVSVLPSLPVISCFTLPVSTYIRPGNPKSKSKSARQDKRFNEIDSLALLTWLRSIGDPEKIVASFEDCPDHAPKASSMRSMGQSAGRILSCLEIAHIKIVRTMPHVWQDEILGKVAKGKTGEAALRVVHKVWPEETWIATPRSTVAHSGLVDAALLAKYYFDKYIN